MCLVHVGADARPPCAPCIITRLTLPGRFEEVLKLTESKSDLQFERAYALYRLKQLPEALRIVRTLPKSAKSQALEAQIVRPRAAPHPITALRSCIV